mmetsp:Transcript_62366/g.190668  ORF Transcript_62366/g.190668 Transcript_62366/m.190668 type:complete len:106 (-) Transcript_62366:53-370(-)
MIHRRRGRCTSSLRQCAAVMFFSGGVAANMEVRGLRGGLAAGVGGLAFHAGSFEVSAFGGIQPPAVAVVKSAPRDFGSFVQVAVDADGEFDFEEMFAEDVEPPTW